MRKCKITLINHSSIHSFIHTLPRTPQHINSSNPHNARSAKGFHRGQAPFDPVVTREQAERGPYARRHRRPGAFVDLCHCPAGCSIRCSCWSGGCVHGNQQQRRNARTASADADTRWLRWCHGLCRPHRHDPPRRVPDGLGIVWIYALHIFPTIQGHSPATRGMRFKLLRNSPDTTSAPMARL